MLFWMNAMESCSSMQYEMKLLVDRQSGHLLVLAQPSTLQNDEEEEWDNVCFPMIIHTTKDQETKDSNNDFHFQLYTYNTKDMEDLLFEKISTNPLIADYDLNVKRTWKDIVQAIHLVTLEQEQESKTTTAATTTTGRTTSLYKDSIVPMNCATYLLELGKQLQIPIDTNLISFVVKNLLDSTYVETTIVTNPIFQQLAKEDGFGNSNDNAAVIKHHHGRRHLEETTAGQLWDPQIVLRRYGEYMLQQQQYPQELLDL